MAELPRKGFDVFAVHDDIQVRRIGKSVMIRGVDNTSNSSDSVEANLLFEILKALKRK